MRKAALSVSLILVLCPVVWAGDSAKVMRTDSRAPYTHRISLYDSDVQIVSPQDFIVRPFSQKGTCSKCHAYGQISGGWHFNSTDEGVPAGRAGQAWILTDLALGVQIPVSNRGWPGTYTLEQVGLTPWEYVLTFGSHAPGGDIAEDFAEKVKDPEARWRISGKLEIDCMMCHSAGASYDRNERANQLAQQNFKWAPTAAMGIAAVRGTAEKMDDDYDPMMPPDPNYPEKAGPQMAFNMSMFDSDERIFFDMDKTPGAENCYFCHTNRTIGQGHSDLWEQDQDVHMASGLTCADCHKHGSDHKIVRGYDKEAELTGEAWRATLSCRGCHMGVESATDTMHHAKGRMGAPQAVHKGLPTLHFERLSCTACHSGPRMEGRNFIVQTARAHGLGLSEQHRSDYVPPLIVEPVIVENEDEVLTPQRMIWPAFWGVMKEGQIDPIPLESVKKAAGKIVPKEVKVDEWKPLTQEQVVGILKALDKAEKSEADVVYVAGGSVHRLDGESLVSEEHQAAEPYSWPLAHDVRPAAQALGSGGCKDCHSMKADFFFSEVKVESPASLGEPKLVAMHEMEGLNKEKLLIWNFTFIFRPLLKATGFAAAGILLVIMLLYALRALEKIMKSLGREQ